MAEAAAAATAATANNNDSSITTRSHKLLTPLRAIISGVAAAAAAAAADDDDAQAPRRPRFPRLPVRLHRRRWQTPDGSRTGLPSLWSIKEGGGSSGTSSGASGNDGGDGGSISAHHLDSVLDEERASVARWRAASSFKSQWFEAAHNHKFSFNERDVADHEQQLALRLAQGSSVLTALASYSLGCVDDDDKDDDGDDGNDGGNTSSGGRSGGGASASSSRSNCSGRRARVAPPAARAGSGADGEWDTFGDEPEWAATARDPAAAVGARTASRRAGCGGAATASAEWRARPALLAKSLLMSAK